MQSCYAPITYKATFIFSDTVACLQTLSSVIVVGGAVSHGVIFSIL